MVSDGLAGQPGPGQGKVAFLDPLPNGALVVEKDVLGYTRTLS